jgi:predicted metal-dependent phosphotriesterase family hydrolase
VIGENVRRIIFCAVFLSWFAASAAASQNLFFMTVNGKMPSVRLSKALIHEHVVTNFIGADSVKIPAHDAPRDVSQFLKYFKALKERGVNLVFECTPAFIGRDVSLLQKVSSASGVEIVTNTGWYSAVDKKYLPAYAYTEDEIAISGRWMNEALHGIEGTAIKPGFIKLGVDKGELDSTEAKLLRAAVIVSKRTGLTIAVHTGDYAAAKSEYEILIRENHKPDKLVWVHAQNASDEERRTLAAKGVYISLDGVSEKNLDEYIQKVLFLKRYNLLSRVLISHDDGWSVLSNGSYESLEVFGNGNSTPYTTIFGKFVPMLLDSGVTQQEVDMIFRENVIKCFAIK